MKKKLYFAFIVSVIFAFTANSQPVNVESSGLMKLRQQTHPEIFKHELKTQSGPSGHKILPDQPQDFGDAPETDFMMKFGGSGEDVMRKTVTDDSGNIYAVIDFSGEMQFAGTDFTSTGKRDVIIMKMDSDGNILWSLQGNSGAESISVFFDICLQGNDVYVTGYFDGPGFSMNGNIVPKTGTEDALLIKLSSEGTIAFIKNFGDTGKKYQGTAVAGENDDVYLSGLMDYAAFGQPSFLAKLDASGNQTWWQEHDIKLTDLAVNGNYLYISGDVYMEVQLDDIVLTPGIYNDAFVAQVNTDGTYNWAVIGEHQNLFGDSWNPRIFTAGTGDVFMAGFYRNSVGFGDFSLTGELESFILRIGQSGEVIWAKTTSYTNNELGAFGHLSDDKICISGDMNSFAYFDDISLETTDSSTGHYAAIYNSDGQAISAFLVDNHALGICNLPGDHILFSGTTEINAYASKYNDAGDLLNAVTGSGNSGTSKLTGLETDGNDIVYSLNNIHGYADFYGTVLDFEKPTMVLAAQKTDGELMWFQAMEGGTSWLNFTETTLKLDTINCNLLLHGDFNNSLNIGGQNHITLSDKYSFFASYSCEGELNWYKIIPYDVNVQSVDVDPDGNAYFVLTFGGTMEIEGQSFTANYTGDALVLKYGVDGTFLSAKQVKTDVFFYQVGIATIPSGGYYLTVEPAGDTIYFNDGANTMVFTPNVGRCVVARYNDQHDFIWAKAFGSSPISPAGYYSWPTSSITDSEDNLYLTGTHGDSAMFDNIILYAKHNNSPHVKFSPFNAKIDPDGNVLWANSIESKNWANNYCEAGIDQQGNFYCMGGIEDTIYFDDWQYVPAGPLDMYVARYDNDGAINWVKTFESTSAGNQMYGLAVYDPDNVFVGGQFTNRIYQGDINLYTSSSTTGNLVHIGVPLFPSGIQNTTFTLVDFDVFPNPANDFVYLRFDDPGQSISFTIMDAQGRIIRKAEMTAPDEPVKIDMTPFPEGSYFIVVYSNGERFTRKLILK